MRLLAATAPAFLLLTAGCAELQDYLPQVRFQQLDVHAVDFEEAEVDFVFAVDNPLPAEVPLSSFSYALALEEIELLTGDQPDGYVLEPEGSSQLVLPVTLGWKETWDVVQAVRGVDHVGFDLDGHFGFDTPMGEADVPYDVDGLFPALRTPDFSLAGLRVVDLDGWNQQVELELDVAVDNAHASNLFFENFQYGIALGGSEVATGTLSELGAVEGDSVGSFSLPIHVKLLDLASGVYEALASSEPLAVDLGAEVDVDTPFGVAPLKVQAEDVLTPQ